MSDGVEFGHKVQRSNNVFIDSWGMGPFKIVIDGKMFLFEDSDRFGPMLLRKNGELRANPYPSVRSVFWGAYDMWVSQGRRTEGDGTTCIWSPSEELLTPPERRAQATMMMWQSIETAPLDGTLVDLWSGVRFTDCRFKEVTARGFVLRGHGKGHHQWEEHTFSVWVAGNGRHIKCPTHWMAAPN